MSILKVDSSFFSGDDINMPNVSSSGSGISGAISSGNNAKLMKLIEKKEPEFLKKVLGKDLYAQFKLGMSVSSPEIPNERWTKIASILVNTDNKVSPFANYVWWWWARYTSTSTSNLGEGVPKQENSSSTSSIYRQVNAWNEMVDMLEELSTYMNDNAALYDNLYMPDNEVYAKQNTYNW